MSEPSSAGSDQRDADVIQPDTSPRARDRVTHLLEEIQQRTPRAAGDRVRLGTPHARSVYLSYQRLSGPREAVLEHAAHMLAQDAARPDAHRAPLELIAIERETADELSVIFSQALYGGE